MVGCQAINWTNVGLSSKVFCGIHLKAIHKILFIVTQGKGSVGVPTIFAVSVFYTLYGSEGRELRSLVRLYFLL